MVTAIAFCLSLLLALPTWGNVLGGQYALSQGYMLAIDPKNQLMVWDHDRWLFSKTLALPALLAPLVHQKQVWTITLDGQVQVMNLKGQVKKTYQVILDSPVNLNLSSWIAASDGVYLAYDHQLWHLGNTAKRVWVLDEEVAVSHNRLHFLGDRLIWETGEELWVLDPEHFETWHAKGLSQAPVICGQGVALPLVTEWQYRRLSDGLILWHGGELGGIRCWKNRIYTQLGSYWVAVDDTDGTKRLLRMES